MTDAVQLSLAHIDIKADASLQDFDAPSFAPIVAAAQELTEGKIRELYLFGNAGTGKSHLLSAIHRHALNTQKRAIFLSLKDIIDTDVQALAGLEMFHLIVIDDIDVAQGRRQWQEALFHLINRAREQKRQLVYSAKVAPSELGFELMDLVTRLSQALSFGLPDGSLSEDRRALLNAILRQKGWQLPDTIKDFMVSEGPHHAGDMTQVLSAIAPYFHYKSRRLPQKLIEEIKNHIREESLLAELADFVDEPDSEDTQTLDLPMTHYLD